MKINITMEGTPEELNDVLDALFEEADEQSAEIDFEKLSFVDGIPEDEPLKVLVSYFKKSGKWYMDEEVEVPVSMLKEYNSTEGYEMGSFLFQFRNWFYEKAQHGEFTGFVNMSEGSAIQQLLGYPMVIKPEN